MNSEVHLLPVVPTPTQGKPMNDDIQMIPIEQIRILNPRHRDQKKFEIIVQNIKNVGLKRPIEVSRRLEGEEEGLGYDLVCGQGRIEACVALGYKEIPAIVVEISKEDRLISSLVENIARRYPDPLDLIREIDRLKALGYSNVKIGEKLDVSDSTVGGLLTLKKAGEERLIQAALTGKIPVWVAVDIAKTDSVETQRELLKAFQEKQLNYLALRTVKRLIEQRRILGKQQGGKGPAAKAKTSAETLVSAYRKEAQRQKLMIKKARICEARLEFVITAFTKLLASDHFVTLLRAESLPTMPKYLWEKVNPQRKEAR
jgi:ParB family chromosome partitioning protein